MSDVTTQMGGACCRTSNWEVRVFWLTLGENADFRQSSRVGQFIARSEKSFDKRKASAVAKLVAEEFPGFNTITVVARHNYGEAAWLKN